LRRAAEPAHKVEGDTMQPEPSPTQVVLAHAQSMRSTDLPAGAERAAAALILDSVGVATAGSTTVESRRLLETAREWGAGEQASVWGTGMALPAATAALINAHQLHCLEFDAIHEPAVVHPMTVVFPTVAGWAQRARRTGTTISGRDFVKAVAVGVDIAAGLGEVTTTPLRFFRPATAGALGAVAALTVAADADPDIAAGAFGVAYGGLSGTMQAHLEGAQVLALQVGFNARAALSSWDLAVAGFRGPRQVLEGTFGYFTLIESDGHPESLAQTLGQQWEVERTSVKPFPSGRASHGVLDMVLTLQRENGFDLKEVGAVHARVPQLINGLVGRDPEPGMPAGTARLCLRYLVAYALRHDGVTLDAYSQASLCDPDLFDMAGRVVVEVDDNTDPNAFNPQTVTVTLRSGAVHTLTLDQSLGSPGRALDPAGLEKKFRDNFDTAGKSDQADEVLGLLRNITELEDITTLLERL
jgi:2-methylcitrate dehydratase PrpD